MGSGVSGRCRDHRLADRPGPGVSKLPVPMPDVDNVTRSAVGYFASVAIETTTQQRRKKMTRAEILESRAEAAGVKLSTWSPGDGMTRYRIHRTHDEYFRAGGSECMTYLGIKEAELAIDTLLWAKRGRRTYF